MIPKDLSQSTIELYLNLNDIDQREMIWINPLCYKSTRKQADTSVKKGTTLIEEEKAALGGVKLG